MALLKLNKNELINYQLIGIETPLPDYKLAYKPKTTYSISKT